jgi:predicted DNA-binding transcriptional regulator AlpA
MHEGFEPARVVDTATAQRLTNIKRKTWLRLRASGEGPPAIRLSKQCLGYLTTDLLAWIEGRRERSPGKVGVEFTALRNSETPEDVKKLI